MLGEDSIRGIDALAFAPQGNEVAVVGALLGKEAAIWDIASGRIARGIEAAAGSADSAAVARDGGSMVYKGRPITFGVLSAVAYSPDGRLLALAGDGVVLRETDTGRVVARFKQPAKGVKAIAFSPDGKTLATAATDRKLRLWHLPSGELTATLGGATQPPTSLAFSPDGDRIVAAGNSSSRSLLGTPQTPHGFLWAWDGRAGVPRELPMGEVEVRQAAFLADDKVVVAAGRSLVEIDLNDGAARPTEIWRHVGNALALAVSPDRRLVAVGGADRTVDIVDLSQKKLVHRLPGLMDIVSAVAASGDGKQFASATTDLRFTDAGSLDHRPSRHAIGPHSRTRRTAAGRSRARCACGRARMAGCIRSCPCRRARSRRLISCRALGCWPWPAGRPTGADYWRPGT